MDTMNTMDYRLRLGLKIGIKGQDLIGTADMSPSLIVLFSLRGRNSTLTMMNNQGSKFGANHDGVGDNDKQLVSQVSKFGTH